MLSEIEYKLAWNRKDFVPYNAGSPRPGVTDNCRMSPVGDESPAAGALFDKGDHTV